MKIKIKITLILFVFFSIFLCWYFRTQRSEIHPRDTLSAYRESSYFELIPVEKYSCIQTPCINVKIDNKIVSAGLDLGFRGGITVSSEFINKCDEKKFIESHLMYGHNGKEFPVNTYEISNLEIGQISFTPPVIQDGNNIDFSENSIVLGGDGILEMEEARVGWKLFTSVNLFLDLKNSTVAICDSIETLKDNGYFLESHCVTPLLLDRGLVEIETKTQTRDLRCVLDTGATWNIINKEVSVVIREQIEQFSAFKIGERDFGPMAFHPLPINLPIHIEALLGMEFFSKHAVFLDFKNSQVFICKHPDLSPSVSM